MDLLVVAPQPVDTQNKEHVPRLKLTKQPFVVGAVEVFSGLLVQVEVFHRDVVLRHGDPLPFFILVFTGYPDVSIFCVFDSIDPLLKCEAILPHSMKKSLPGVSGRE